MFRYFSNVVIITLLATEAWGGQFKTGMRLMNAISSGSEVRVGEEIQSGADVNYQNGSPLIRAIEKAPENPAIYRGIVKQLLLRGAEPNGFSSSSWFSSWFRSWKYQPFDLADQQNGFPEYLIVFGGTAGSRSLPDFLRAEGASAFRNYVVANPLLRIVLTGTIQELDAYLRNTEASVELKSRALAFAASQGMKDTVRLLLRYGAKPDQVLNDLGLTPSQILSGILKREQRLNSNQMKTYYHIKALYLGEFYAFFEGFQKRISRDNRDSYIDSVSLNGRDFDIRSTDSPLTSAYTIHPQDRGIELLNQLKNAPNWNQLIARNIVQPNSDGSVTISQDDFGEDIPETIFEEVANRSRELIARGALSTAQKVSRSWTMRPIPEFQVKEINRIAGLIEQGIAQINARHGGHFVRPSAGAPSADIWIHHNLIDRMNMIKILKAIDKQKEESFVARAVLFSTGYPMETVHARTDFIRAFATLFVTLSFPSEGSARSFMHFILRCGHLH